MTQNRSPSPRTCLRCSTPLEPGVIPDRGHYDAEIKQAWKADIPSDPSLKAWFLGVDRARYYVAALRCPTCGMIELVATEPA